MIALALVGLLACQAPVSDVQREQDRKSSQSSSSKKLETWPDKLAKQKVKAFQQALKPKKVSMADRKRALAELQGGKSQHLIKPLQKFIETDRSVVLRREAIEMLGDQPKARAKKAILKLLGNARVTGNPQVQAGLIRSLSKAGYTSKDWQEIDDVFAADYDNERIPVHEAILELVKVHEEKQALDLLLDNLDEPIPGNVDAADNPPAAYWKARWHAWAAWKSKVKEALKAITGQDFGSAKEARAWLKKNPLK
ncbi:MAG: HEAT repeat domain-containing protein [Planctomycetes bacterium]|nr:HEAT repeat domain-containing protein [Planctomycetota bacterium]